MLPAAIALAAGILLASWRMTPAWVAAAGVAICTATAAVALRRDRRRTAAVLTVAATMFLGAALTALQRGGRWPADGGYRICEIELTTDARAAAGARSRQADARMLSLRGDDGHWHRVRHRLRVYADTTLRLTAGQRIVGRVHLRPFGGGNNGAGDGSSGSDGYARMMRRKGYAGSVWLGRDNVLQVNDGRRGALARSLHRRAVAKIEQLPLAAENRAVALALGTGESSMLGRDLRTEYSRAGMAHLLALSGLHVGIVYLLINLLIGWLPLLRHGNILRSAAAIVLLWLYVLSTGMPPSAIRAALMFTMLQLARASSSDYMPMNVLAVAAFVTLCCDTGMVFDAGFRLSYIAVASLILCAVPICRRLHIRTDRHSHAWLRYPAAAANFVTDTVVTGFVATAATAPLVSHLFGVIPLAGIAAGPVAIALAAATVLLTALWIVFPAASAAPLFGRAIDLTAGALNSLSTWIASHDGAAVAVRLTAGQTVAVYIAAAAAILLTMQFARTLKTYTRK